MHMRNNLRDTVATEANPMSNINTKLTRWWNEVEDYLEQNESHRPSMSDFHQLILSVLRHESILASNRSVLAGAKSNITYDEALHNCIASARGALNMLHKAISTQGLSVPLLWPSFTWAAWISAFLLLHAAEEGQVPQGVANKYV
jgi:hypothetical protein